MPLLNRVAGILHSTNVISSAGQCGEPRGNWAAFDSSELCVVVFFFIFSRTLARLRMAAWHCTASEEAQLNVELSVLCDGIRNQGAIKC